MPGCDSVKPLKRRRRQKRFFRIGVAKVTAAGLGSARSTLASLRSHTTRSTRQRRCILYQKKQQCIAVPPGSSRVCFCSRCVVRSSCSRPRNPRPALMASALRQQVLWLPAFRLPLRAPVASRQRATPSGPTGAALTAIKGRLRCPIVWSTARQHSQPSVGQCARTASRCAAISFSTQHRDCSWFSRCSAEEVTNRVRGFLTMRRHGFEAPQSDPCAPDASLAEQRRCAVASTCARLYMAITGAACALDGVAADASETAYLRV